MKLIPLKLMLLAVLFIPLVSTPAQAEGYLTKSDLLGSWDKVEKAFAKDLEERGFKFEAEIVDASHTRVASVRFGTISKIFISTNLMENKKLTTDHILNILCHELGHELGGAPYIEKFPGDSMEMTVEAQADYFASAKCLRRVLNNDAENKAYVENLSKRTIKKIKARECTSNQCIRIANISYETLKTLALNEKVSLSKTAKETVEETSHWIDYPSAQCRLDTQIAGAICPVSEMVNFGDYDQSEGSCHLESEDELFKLGARPKCWFKPYDLHSYY